MAKNIRDKPLVRDLEPFTAAAHRGASVQFPPNTMEAFRRAVEIIPDCLLETDLRKTADGKAVILHDSYLDIKTDGTGPVSKKSLEKIKQLDAGYNVSFDRGRSYPFRDMGFRIPTLEQVLLGFPDSRFSLDIKDNDIQFARQVMAVIENHGAGGRVIMGSFHPRIVTMIRREYPGVATSFERNEIIRYLLLFRTGLPGLFKPRGDVMMIPELYFGGTSEYRIDRPFGNGIRIVTKKFIDNAHEKGLPVFVWTINNRENMKRLISWNVNGIVTDYPDILRNVLSETRSGILEK